MEWIAPWLSAEASVRVLRLLLASLLSGLIGIEREVHGRAAGFRTHLLVGLATCLMMIVSEYFFRKYGGLSSQGVVRLDPARVAAQVVTGIGFLGAGVIIKSGEVVRGLTTAACLWLVAGIGMAVGIGLYLPALIVTAIAMFNLVFLKQIERLVKKDRFYNLEIDSQGVDNIQEEVMRIFNEKKLHVVDVGVEKDAADGTSRYHYVVSTNRTWDPDAVVGDLLKMTGIQRVRFR
jgi:putative Mg2+ transporter-C (MgtC) family protein